MQLVITFLLISALGRYTSASYPYAVQSTSPYYIPNYGVGYNVPIDYSNLYGNLASVNYLGNNLAGVNSAASSLASANSAASSIASANSAARNLASANTPTNNLASTNYASIYGGSNAGNLVNPNYFSNNLASANAAAATKAASKLANANYLSNARANAASSNAANFNLASRNVPKLANNLPSCQVTATTPVNLAHGLHINSGTFASRDTGLAQRVLGDTPCGVQILADALQVDGQVGVSGRMPFQSTITVNGALPTSGYGVATCGCGFAS